MNASLDGEFLEAARPLEPQAAWFAASRCRELSGDLRPLINVLRSHFELRSNEDHVSLRSAGTSAAYDRDIT
jgi:hypothetical protein